MKAKILVVEDQKIIALEITQRLEEMGYEVAGTAATGKAAIQLAADLAPDLVLMDVHLEGSMDGIEAASQIKNNPSTCNIPIFALTAMDEDFQYSKYGFAHLSMKS